MLMATNYWLESRFAQFFISLSGGFCFHSQASKSRIHRIALGVLLRKPLNEAALLVWRNPRAFNGARYEAKLLIEVCRMGLLGPRFKRSFGVSNRLIQAVWPTSRKNAGTEIRISFDRVCIVAPSAHRLRATVLASAYSRRVRGKRYQNHPSLCL